MNTVNENNFNLTMKGYTKYAISFMRDILSREGYAEDQLNRMEQVIDHGFRWAKDEMTMEDARRLAEK